MAKKQKNKKREREDISGVESSESEEDQAPNAERPYMWPLPSRRKNPGAMEAQSRHLTQPAVREGLQEG